jgi:ribosomal protein S18 acetylase RimI-like enzyme
VSDDEASVAALLRHPTSRCVVAEHDGAIVGSVIVGWDGWRAHLYRLAVDPGHRRQGIAGALVTEAELWASERGAVRLDALVDSENDDGTGFWAAQGFRPNPTYVRFERTVA